tara:strand:+ start:5068 stop:6000 length:933 start_codon:yes stop_codon:yes gene_type:complete
MLFIGFRHKVGGDWDIYIQDFYTNIKFFNLLKFEYHRDYGFELISYFLYKIGLDIYFVNLTCACIFVYCLYQFSKKRENIPFIFAISFPYLITIVAMGYTRQSVAIAFILLSINAIEDNKLFKYFLLTIFGIIFHKSCVVIVPLIILSYSKFNLKTIILIILLFVVSYTILRPDLSRIYAGYLHEGIIYHSYGAYYRISINILLCFFWLFFFKRINLSKYENKFIFFVLFSCIILLFFVDKYSTFVDRVNIYLSIIQLMIVPKFFYILPRNKIIINSIILSMYGFMYFIWLNYSPFAHLWIPYNNLLFFK